MSKKLDRLLGTAGTKGCEFGCIYCFTFDPKYERYPLLDCERPRDLIAETNKVEIVQPVCDTELFLLDKWEEYLDKIASTGKVISFATKAILESPEIDYLKKMNDLLMSKGAVLHVCITIVRLHDWQELEPNAPSPKERIKVLRKLWEAGIGTCVAIRPMMPFLDEHELEEIVSRTYRFCYGYLSGPLYLTEKFKKYLTDKDVTFETERRKASWQQNEPKLEVVHSSFLEERLAEFSKKYGREYFENNYMAASFVCKKRIQVSKKPDWSPEVRREPVATIYILDPSTKQFLLIFHRNLGAWLAPGGHIELGESAEEAALREAKEEMGLAPKVVRLESCMLGKGESFRAVATPDDSPAFCTLEELIESVWGHDDHIHSDSIIVGYANSSDSISATDSSEVVAYDWFTIEQIEKEIQTFDNVPIICRAILSALD